MASPEQAEQQTQTVAPIREDAQPREALVATAVKFLQNEKVRQSPLATRKAFLKKKGLTDEEVELAIQRSGSIEQQPLAVAPLGRPGPAHPLLPPQPAPVPYGSPGSRWRDYGALAIIMAGMAVGFHHLYRKYILPLIVGSKEDKKHLQRMETSMAEMSGTLTQTVTQLQTTLASVQELLAQQQQRIQQLTQELASSEYSEGFSTSEGRRELIPPCRGQNREAADSVLHPLFHQAARGGEAASASSRMLESQAVSELKAEIVSLKGLLLSRRQFPATPSVPKIPSWQIPLKPSTLSGTPSVNHNNSSSDISPVSNESTSSSPAKEGHSPQGPQAAPHGLNAEGTLGPQLPLDLKDQVRMEVQGEEERREDEEEEEEEDDDVSHVEEEEQLAVQTEDRRGGDGQINEQVDKLRRPEGASNESEVD